MELYIFLNTTPAVSGIPRASYRKIRISSYPAFNFTFLVFSNIM